MWRKSYQIAFLSSLFLFSYLFLFLFNLSIVLFNILKFWCLNSSITIILNLPIQYYRRCCQQKRFKPILITIKCSNQCISNHKTIVQNILKKSLTAKKHSPTPITFHHLKNVLNLIKSLVIIEVTNYFLLKRPHFLRRLTKLIHQIYWRHHVNKKFNNNNLI